MTDQDRANGLRLLRAARNNHVEQHSGAEESFGAGTALDLVAAGERAELPTGYPPHEAAVEWLDSAGAIEPDPHRQGIFGGSFYRITAQGVRMLEES